MRNKYQSRGTKVTARNAQAQPAACLWCANTTPSFFFEKHFIIYKVKMRQISQDSETNHYEMCAIEPESHGILSPITRTDNK